MTVVLHLTFWHSKTKATKKGKPTTTKTHAYATGIILWGVNAVSCPMWIYHLTADMWCLSKAPVFQPYGGNLNIKKSQEPLSFPIDSDSKESACNAGHLDSVPGSGRSLGGGHSNPLQYSCLENLHGQRNLAGYSPRGRKESDTTEWLRTGASGIAGWTHKRKTPSS